MLTTASWTPEGEPQVLPTPKSVTSKETAPKRGGRRRPSLLPGLMCKLCGCMYHSHDCGKRYKTAGCLHSLEACPRCSGLCACADPPGPVQCFAAASRKRMRERRQMKRGVGAEAVRVPAKAPKTTRRSSSSSVAPREASQSGGRSLAAAKTESVETMVAGKRAGAPTASGATEQTDSKLDWQPPLEAGTDKGAARMVVKAVVKAVARHTTVQAAAAAGANGNAEPWVTAHAAVPSVGEAAREQKSVPPLDSLLDDFVAASNAFYPAAPMGMSSTTPHTSNATMNTSFLAQEPAAPLFVEAAASANPPPPLEYATALVARPRG